MTEYWVSQGNKWCDFCKIYIANNPLSVRTHELGQRHKDNVAKRLATMRKESAAKEKEQKEAARALQQIEAKAQRSYQKDLASFQGAKSPSNGARDGSMGEKPSSVEAPAPKTSEDASISKYKGGPPPPGLVISSPLNPMRPAVKGASSSIAVNKRKREDVKPKAITKDEEAALKAREAARKRVEGREKPLLGLYRSY